MKTISWNKDGEDAVREESAGRFGAADAARLAHGYYNELIKEAADWAERRIEDHTARLHEIIKEQASNGRRRAYWRGFSDDDGEYVQDDDGRFEGVDRNKTGIFYAYILPGVMKRLKDEGFIVDHFVERVFGKDRDVVRILLVNSVPRQRSAAGFRQKKKGKSAMSHFCVYVFHDENTTAGELLAPYDENLEVAPYVLYTKEQAVAKVRSEIEKYRNSIYREYLADPVKYKENCSNKEHIDYLENEFPKKLNWTDEECYADIEQYCDARLAAEDGSILSTRNPKSKWDWYQIGGRWSGAVPGDEAKTSEIPVEKISAPYAFVTPDGEWVERGEMGWFGTASNEMDEDEWDSKFREYLKTLDKDVVLTVVDCHI